VGTVASQKEREYTAFSNPERITIRGYSDHAMEPFISRDGRYLFFNNSNDPSVNTNLHYAERINDLTYEYKGEVGKNGPVIYRSTRKNVTQPFDPPERIAAIKGFVEAPTLSPDGRSLYYHRKDGERFVIYRVTRSPLPDRRQ